jgi:glycosyltransferase involved in cell wall biosynthesis
MEKRGGIVAIAWSPSCVRTKQYAKRLNAKAHMIHYLQWKRPLLAPVKYIPQWIKTWMVLYRERPSAVYVPIPPPFAALCVALYCRVMGIPFVMDKHGHSLTGRKWSWTAPLQRWLARQARVSIVDQERYRRLFEESWDARAVLLERPPLQIDFDKLQRIDDPEQFGVTVVNTFAGDEPLDIVLDAARALPDVPFYVLGDTARAPGQVLETAPQNVIFPGYLHNEDYWNRLYSSRALIVLTTEKYSLLGGAQEGMSLGKPLIISDQPALREYFTKGTVFVDHTADSIRDAVLEAREHEARLAQESLDMAAEKRQRWEVEFQRLLTFLEDSSYHVQPQPVKQ